MQQSYINLISLCIKATFLKYQTKISALFNAIMFPDCFNISIKINYLPKSSDHRQEIYILPKILLEKQVLAGLGCRQLSQVFGLGLTLDKVSEKQKHSKLHNMYLSDNNLDHYCY